MESPQDPLHDEYPVGWVLTYRCGSVPGGWASGTVLGPPLRDPGTGLETIPLAPPGGAAPVWVADRDVVGIGPRPADSG